MSKDFTNFPDELLSKLQEIDNKISADETPLELSRTFTKFYDDNLLLVKDINAKFDGKIGPNVNGN